MKNDFARQVRREHQVIIESWSANKDSSRLILEDDPLDEKCWGKANPSLGITIHTEHLRKTRDEVQQDPSGMNAWLQYHCNIWPEVSLSRQGKHSSRKVGGV